jgi:hypothetical protein
MTLKTDRLSLPLLAVAQAQKEMTHNEALALIDALIQPVVTSVAPASVPLAPTAGQGWIVGIAATGPWAGRDNALAVWTAGGWRFASAFVGMTVWSLADSMMFRRTATAWVAGALTGLTLTLDGNQVVGARGAPIALPSGGATVDAEARVTLAAILDRLRVHGLIAV